MIAKMHTPKKNTMKAVVKTLFILPVLFVWFSCEDKTETRYFDVEALSASELYNSDSVFAYMNRYKEKNKDLANAYMEKAKQHTNNPEKAIYYLKRSISLLPTQERYKELVALLSAQKRYDEVSKLYYLLLYEHHVNSTDQKQEYLYLFGPPDEDMVYENLLNNFLRWNSINAEEVYLAEEMGFKPAVFKERLMEERRISINRNSPEFKNMLLQFLPYDHLDSIARQPETFRNFIASIRDTNEHFQINTQAVSDFNYELFKGEGDMMGINQQAIDVFYLKEKQENKDAWFEFNFNHCYKAFPSVNVVVYAIDTSATACPREMRHVYHRLTTYTDNGNVIDSKVIAFQSAEDLVTAEVNKTSITTFPAKRSWKKPYNKWDFDNRVTTIKTAEAQRYEIQEDGIIKQINLAEITQ